LVFPSLLIHSFLGKFW